MNEYKLYQPPKVVGYWILNGNVDNHWIAFSCYKKPCWFHRTMMRLLLGFDYREESK